MVDVEKLIERLEAWNEQHLSVVCENGHFACDYLCENEDCIVVQAATALSTLQAENEKLRADLEQVKEKNAGLALALLTECAPNPDCLGDDEWRAIRAELEQVKRNLDSAVEHLRGQCRYCKHNLVCKSRKGPHSNCWEWRGPQKEE